MQDEIVVDCHAVSHHYGASVALDGVSLTLPTATTTALIGPDGVGKSSLLGLIAGVRRMQSGEVSVFGGDMRSARHRDLISNRIAYMPQGLGRNLYPSLSVVENLDFMGRLFGLSGDERRRRIDRLLQAIGLAEFPNRPAGQLSGGMKQKLSLCAALLHDPDLLILDEPTTGIDPLSRRQFWALIDALRTERGGMTVVVATAYMEEAEGFDRVCVLDHGRVLDSGPVREVLGRAGAASLDVAYVSLQSRDGRPAPAPFEMPSRQNHDGPPAIRAEGLTRRFGAFTAVDDVSFSIERGEIFGFLGSNGCGKTTTMKMLTGLLPASAGRAWLLGQPIEAHDVDVRLKVGYMSQSFSLYQELSVRSNLELHARLYRLEEGTISSRVSEALRAFDLQGVSGTMPMSLPLGQRQRLQLAVACLHEPEVLILDEPTSGVDPAARDRFWTILGYLSRTKGVTIFISTHFMNEAERCDRISLMHAGKVLAVGAPNDLIKQQGAADLDEAFVRFMTEAAGTMVADFAPPQAIAGTRNENLSSAVRVPSTSSVIAGSFGRIWAFARREGVELLRDRIRLAFALLGPIVLLLTFGYGISFDVDDLRFATLDRDQSAESRRLAEAFAGSRYFIERRPALSDREADQRLRSGELHLLIAIPPGFGRDLASRRRPELGFFVNGTSPFRGETMRGYVEGIMHAYAEERAREAPIPGGVTAFEIASRFRYNQSFKTVFAIMPGTIMMIMAMIPSMLAAIGIVREREIGSITNLYVSPAGGGEFLLGKQLPYIVLSFVSFLSLLLIAILHFGLLVKGSLAGLLLAGLFYAFAMTAFGMLVSSFVGTQVAALIATAVICQVPALNFSGYLHPAGSLEGSGYVIGHVFPALYFQNVSIGTFAKTSGFLDLASNYAVLAALGVVFLLLARLFLDKQEK
jgi:ribosome-dependent ATPase